MLFDIINQSLFDRQTYSQGWNCLSTRRVVPSIYLFFFKKIVLGGIIVELQEIRSLLKF